MACSSAAQGQSYSNVRLTSDLQLGRPKRARPKLGSFWGVGIGVSGAGTSVHAVYSMQVDMLLSFCQCTVVLLGSFEIA